MVLRRTFPIFALLFFAIFTATLISGCIQEKRNDIELRYSAQWTPKEIYVPSQASATPVISETPLRKVHVALSIDTDKKEYRSNERAVITVTAIASDTVPNAKVKVWGITAQSRNYIQSEKTLDLVQGENTIEFNATMPYCTSGCGGVYPGSYLIYASVEANGFELGNAKTEIILLKG